MTLAAPLGTITSIATWISLGSTGIMPVPIAARSITAFNESGVPALSNSDIPRIEMNHIIYLRPFELVQCLLSRRMGAMVTG